MPIWLILSARDMQWKPKLHSGGFGLDYYLNIKGENYTGILNGADYSRWDPEKDPLIPVNYTADDLEGKSECKKVLRNRLGWNKRVYPGYRNYKQTCRAKRFLYFNGMH